MRLRSGVLVVLLAMCGLAAFVAVGHAGAGDRAQLLQCLERIPTVLGTP
jgi:hypothetical protein